ncbi:uncharacterized protein LOC115555032 [Gadus morhua]|uniref:uncharacterized protein LOC115555032 n=1 Tax=Gadus morhua TaxID=8049 RepID=UPI0011B6648C|nr:uncharacterized protein LOC115555032 [Gadus morhua]
MMEFKMGFRSEKRVRLKAGVIPSIHAAPAAASGSATGGSEDHGPVRDSTIRKRELCTLLGNTARFEATDAPTASEDSEQEAVASLASQPKSVLHFGSQCHIRPPYRSSAIQVQTQTVSVGTQTELCVSSIPLPSPVQTEDESSSVSRDQPDDRSWSEVEEMSVSSSEEESEPKQGSQWDFGVADKFIVCLTQLMALFIICPACCGETNGNVEQQQGTFVQIKQAWKNEQADIVSQLKEMGGGGLILSGFPPTGDRQQHRASFYWSPYGTYTVIEDRINRFWIFNLSK